MQRGIDKKSIYNLIEKLRKEIEGVFLRTTLIVGFPGESEKEFEELIEFVKEVRFERLGCFVYSREEGTPAYRIKGQVPLKEKSRRFDLLMSLQQEIAGELNRKLLGRRLQLLIDAEESEHYIGRTEYDAPEVDGVVYLQKTKGIKIGEFRMVKIMDCMEYDLLAECT
jgi:ribosomal protein S12 methylthiotransferase